MEMPNVSVVVVSRARPKELDRCLTSLSQLDYDPYEIIVVACSAGEKTVRARADAEHIKLIGYDEANISAARNRGITQAAGEIVAFIDDDAAAEPNWLTWLVKPFSDPAIAAAGGTVLGRNGISVQWSAASVNLAGNSKPLNLETDDTIVLSPTSDWMIKTEGTNMAFRREVLAELGGFDPLFRYYLDETDMNVRIGKAKHDTAFVPRAVVHHGFARNAVRRSDRAPKSLRQIGFSKEIFLRKHCPEWSRDAARKKFTDEQRDRLLRLMISGHLMADDVALLTRSLRVGMRQAEKEGIHPPALMARSAKGFQPYPGRSGAERVVLSGSWLGGLGLRKKARAAVADGKIVSVYRFSRSTFFHKVIFTKYGYWLQKGGLWGKSLRTDKSVRFWSRSARLARETDHVASRRDDLAKQQAPNGAN